jgi:hypothetical protein
MAVAILALVDIAADLIPMGILAAAIGSLASPIAFFSNPPR